MFSVVLFALLGQAPGEPAPKSIAGLPPVQGVASMDGKGNLAIARVTTMGGYGMGDRELWLKAPEKKPGEKVMVRAKVTQMIVTIVEVPAGVVEAYTVDGKVIAPAKLAEMLAKERAVLISVDGKKLDPFHVQLYKEDTIILVPPANLGQLDLGPYGVPPGPPPYEMPRPPEKVPFDKGKASSAPANHDFISQDDEKEKTPEAPAMNGIGGILRVRDKLPRTAPPSASTVVLDLGNLTLMRPVIEYRQEMMRVRDTVVVQVPVVVVVNVNGRLEKRTEVRTETKEVERDVAVAKGVVRLVKQIVPAEKVKAFLVTKAGTLESIPQAALLEMLAKPTPALIGDADLDPRHLELIRPGTLFLAIPPEGNRPAPPPGEPILPKKET